MAREPTGDSTAEQSLPPSTARLVPFRGGYPAGTCLVRFSVQARSQGGLRLYARREGETSSTLVHEFAIPRSGRVDHLVYLPPTAKELVVRTAEGDPLPRIWRFRIHALGIVPLTTLLAARWAARQLREPRRAGEKVANAARVLFRQGVRGAAARLVASQAARQSLGPEPPPPQEAERYAHGGRWAEERYPPAPVSKRAIDRTWERELRSFLRRGGRLRLPHAEQPSLCIVMITHNHAARSLACLRSIAHHAPSDAEVILVDNASSDETSLLLRRLDGARILENDENVGFLRACNQAVTEGSGPFVLLLNNDALLLPGSVEAAVRTLDSSPAVGVTGGRMIALDGTLQEAGSIIWRDGSCRGYGRGNDPNAPEYRFRRDVHFVSGAFLLTRRQLWEQLGGFDEAFVPAYYEDADYCMRARTAGWRVVYEPDAVIVHYEYGSSSPSEAQAGMRRNQQVFLARHEPLLMEHPSPDPRSEIEARSVRSDRGRVLMIDDRVPLATSGSGTPRAASLLRALVSLGWEVTFYPMLPFAGDWREVYRAVPAEVEVMLGSGRDRLKRFLTDRGGSYERMLVSRAHNMALLNDLLAEDPGVVGDALVVYDAEAIGALRTVCSRQALGDPLSPEEAARLVKDELSVARGAQRVTAVSSEEARAFENSGVREVHLVSHGIDPTPTERPFHLRRSFLFVGRLIEDGSPNVDALVWFLDNVFPLIRERLEEDPPEMVVAGKMSSVALAGRLGPGVQLLGPVEDLTPLYEDARVFVAPHRFAAGAPFKVIEAAGYGVPVVATDLLCSQLGWTAGQELLAAPVGDFEAFAANCVRLFRDEQLWFTVRQASLERLAREASVEQITASLARAIR
jgi:O-antigen biosynthesis protein